MRKGLAKHEWGTWLVLLFGWLWVFQVQASTTVPKVTVKLMVTNAQGTVVATMTPQGDVTYTAAYRPYGKQVEGTPQDGPGYTGHVNDPDTGLVYMQQRYYDAAVGRFISPDPVGPAPGNVFNFNRFAYANNNPVRFIDPSGACVGAPASSFDSHSAPDPACPDPTTRPRTPNGCGITRSCIYQDGNWSTMNRKQEGYWRRVADNWKNANTSIFGTTAPTGTGIVLKAGRAVRNTTSLPTLLEAGIGSYNQGYLTMELWAGAANSLIGMVAVGSSWEGGLFVGSMINQASVPGTNGKTVETALTPAADRTAKFLNSPKVKVFIMLMKMRYSGALLKSISK